MKKILALITVSIATFVLAGCTSSDDAPRRSSLPTRQSGASELPWAKPASWEGGLPGMGGVTNSNGY